MHSYVADVHGSLIEVDAQLGKFNSWEGLFRVGAPQRGAYAGKQLPDSKRFNDVIVRSRVERCDLVSLCVTDRYHNDGPVKRHSNLVAGLKPAHTGHVHIQKNKLRTLCDHHFNRFLPALRFYDLVPITRKSRPQNASDLRLIIDDKNCGSVHCKRVFSVAGEMVE